MGFSRFINNIFNAKSGLRRTVSKIAGGVDRAIMGFGKAARPIGGAIAAAVPEAAPAIAGIEGALSSYERIRKAVAG